MSQVRKGEAPTKALSPTLFSLSVQSTPAAFRVSIDVISFTETKNTQETQAFSEQDTAG